MTTTLTGYSAREPLLLVTDYPASAGGGGAVILRSLLSDGDRASIVWVSPSPENGVPQQDVTLASGSAGLRSWLGRRSMTVDSLLATRLADEIRDVASKRRARAVWFVMHGAIVHVAARFLARKTMPVHLTVHDDPAFGVALMSRRYIATLPLVEHDFSYAIRRCDSVDVISDGMARRYRRRYRVDSVVVHRGTEGSIARRASSVEDGVFDVGVMGNTYGYHQLPLLARVVERVARSIGRRPRVTVIGQGLGERLRVEMSGRVEVEVTGHLDEATAVERLARCFALYVNYPFSGRAAVLRQTSFPTKLSSYLMAGRPLLAHAPTDSSIAALADRHGYVAWWGSERIEDGDMVLRRLWDTPTAHESQHVAAEQLRQRYYGLTSNRKNLFDALNSLG